MTDMPLLAELWAIGMESVPASHQDVGPVVIGDGRPYRLAELTADLRVDRARVVGLRPAHVDRLATLLRTRALALYDVQVDDLSFLQRLDGLEWLGLTWNTKVTSLEPLAALKGLTRLSISDTPKVR